MFLILSNPTISVEKRLKKKLPGEDQPLVKSIGWLRRCGFGNAKITALEKLFVKISQWVFELNLVGYHGRFGEFVINECSLSELLIKLELTGRFQGKAVSNTLLCEGIRNCFGEKNKFPFLMLCSPSSRVFSCRDQRRDSCVTDSAVKARLLLRTTTIAPLW